MLLKNENQIFRVLQTQGDKSLVIDCIKKTMPKWVDAAALSVYTECSEAALHELTHYTDKETVVSAFIGISIFSSLLYKSAKMYRLV